jgi:TPR repeat protein
MAEQQEAGFSEAIKFYRQAVDQGSEAALLHLGALAAAGQLQGTMAPHYMVPWVTALAAQQAKDSTPDAAEAEGRAAATTWLQTQAEAGLRPAQAALGQLLLTGGDASAASTWLAQAAATGDVEAQHQLGRLYIQGDGVQQDYVQAHKWLNVAAASGSSEALAMRAVVADLMTPEQVAEAQALARQFFAIAKPGGTE